MPLWFSNVEHLQRYLKKYISESVSGSVRGYWLLMFETLLITQDHDQFDEMGLQFAVEYEESPPAWEQYVNPVAETAAIGRPAILVPFPHALDADQAANAAELARTGAVEVIDQKAFTVEKLTELLRAALADPEGLTKRAEAAKSAGILDAAERLADIVIASAESREIKE